MPPNSRTAKKVAERKKKTTTKKTSKTSKTKASSKSRADQAVAQAKRSTTKSDPAASVAAVDAKKSQVIAAEKSSAAPSMSSAPVPAPAPTRAAASAAAPEQSQPKSAVASANGLSASFSALQLSKRSGHIDDALLTDTSRHLLVCASQAMEQAGRERSLDTQLLFNAAHQSDRYGYPYESPYGAITPYGGPEHHPHGHPDDQPHRPMYKSEAAPYADHGVERFQRGYGRGLGSDAYRNQPYRGEPAQGPQYGTAYGQQHAQRYGYGPEDIDEANRGYDAHENRRQPYQDPRMRYSGSPNYDEYGPSPTFRTQGRHARGYPQNGHPSVAADDSALRRPAVQPSTLRAARETFDTLQRQPRHHSSGPPRRTGRSPQQHQTPHQYPQQPDRSSMVVHDPHQHGGYSPYRQAPGQWAAAQRRHERPDPRMAPGSSVMELSPPQAHPAATSSPGQREPTGAMSAAYASMYGGAPRSGAPPASPYERRKAAAAERGRARAPDGHMHPTAASLARQQQLADEAAHAAKQEQPSVDAYAQQYGAPSTAPDQYLANMRSPVHQAPTRAAAASRNAPPPPPPAHGAYSTPQASTREALQAEAQALMAEANEQLATMRSRPAGYASPYGPTNNGASGAGRAGSYYSGSPAPRAAVSHAAY